MPDWDSPDLRKADNQPLAKRLAWMAAIWAMSVAALGAVAYAIRWWLNG